MNAFLHNIINPVAVLMLFIILYAFSVHVWGTFRSTPNATVAAGSVRIWSILWVILGLLALIAWWFLVFA